MITVRNAETCQSVSARAGQANLKPGMVVKFAAGAASGDQPTVVAVTAADLDAATAGTITLGIVDYVQPDSLDTDFTIDPATQVLTPVAKTIPNGAQVNVWMNKPIIGYHKDDLDASLDPATVREPQKVAFLVANGMPAAFNAAAVDTGAENYMGFVYRVDGPEVTLLFASL